MMNLTQIEWVKKPPPLHIKVDATGRWHDPTGKFAEQPGYTWNPITGCLNGCEYCYARKLANGRLRARYLANDNIALRSASQMMDVRLPIITLKEAHTDPFYPRQWFGRREPALESKKPKGIFVCDMSDLFGIGIPRDWTQHVINLIRLSPQHRFYLLTKQPQNLIKFSPFPDNCWVGVTATDDFMYQEARRKLRDIQASIRFISFEPLLSDIALTGMGLERAGIDWVIIGSQTKPYKPPKREWVDEIIGACSKAQVPVFLKNNLVPMFNDFNKTKFPHSPELWDMTGLIKQEMPHNTPLI